jgi:glycosyltransferase involved in cell wall biosynthesis
MKLLIVTQAVDAKHPVLGFFVRWIEEFAKHAESIEVICLQKGEYTLPQNVRVHSLGKEQGGSRVIYVLRFYAAIWRLRHEYDAVFVHMNPEYVVLAGMLWRLWGKPATLWYMHKSVNLWLRIATFFATIVFTASKESFRLTTNKLHVMGHGIDTERHIPKHIPSSGAIRLMTSGRVTPIKRIDVIVGAFLELKRRGISATLSIFGAPTSPGDEAYQAGLCTKLREAGENPDAVFMGSIPHAQMPIKRASMDYFLHASETGSLDKTILDASISGVISFSSSEAYGDLFAGFEQYLAYPQGDSTALASRIVALEALSPQERAHIRDTLKARVIASHSLGSLISAILKDIQVYDSRHS